ncbi:response regulator [Thermodesulfobacteriota bacterium]
MYKILIIEDDLVVQNVTRELVEILGYNVITAASAGEAFELIDNSEETIHLVILDMSLPDASGVDIIPDIKKKLPDSLIVVCTGATVTDDDSEVISSWGIKDILQKPFEFKIMRDTLQALLPIDNS